MTIVLTNIVLLLAGLGLAGGGAWLIALGDTPYYLLAGLGFLATAVLLHRRSRVALLVFAAVILGTLIWALFEVGFDWWQLAPRGGVVIILGVWLLMPWVRSRLYRRSVTDEAPARWADGLCWPRCCWRW